MSYGSRIQLGAALLCAVAGLFVGGCATAQPDIADVPAEAEAPQPAEEETLDQPVIVPLLAQGEGATYEPAGATPVELLQGESVEVSVGESLLVHEGGAVTLEWRAGDEDRATLSGSLLAETELAVDDIDASVAAVALRQTGGSARYWVAPSAPPADVSVAAGSVTVVADQGAADFTISYTCASEDDPEDERLVWVVVASGETEVKGCRPPGDSGAKQVCVVTQGRAASFMPDGTVVDIEKLRPSSIESWFASLRGGSCNGPVAALAQADEASDASAGADRLASVSTAVVPPEVTFTVDHQQIAPNACTTVRWTAVNVSAVWLDGTEVSDIGSQQVCPSGDSSYTLSWLGYDGVEDQRVLAVRVVGGERQETEDEDRDDEQDAEEPEPGETEECVGDECEATVDPFVFPTSPPLEPTKPVEPTEVPPEPTDAPPPTDESPTEAPTEPPAEPTEPPAEPTEPPPEPTDPPVATP